MLSSRFSTVTLLHSKPGSLTNVCPCFECKCFNLCNCKCHFLGLQIQMFCGHIQMNKQMVWLCICKCIQIHNFKCFFILNVYATRNMRLDKQ